WKAQAQFRQLFHSRTRVAAAAHRSRHPALPRRIPLVPARARPLDVAAGAARSFHRHSRRASFAATRRNLVGAAEEKERAGVIRPLSHWVMVGCLQGKTRASWADSVNNWLTA